MSSWRLVLLKYLFIIDGMVWEIEESKRRRERKEVDYFVKWLRKIWVIYDGINFVIFLEERMFLGYERIELCFRREVYG